MLETSPTVDAAFQQLLAALDAEIVEFKKVGGEIFHNGAPRQAQAILRRANDHAVLRQRIADLHAQWKAGISSPAPSPTPQPTIRYFKFERAQPGLIRNIKGMTTSAAAKKLGVPPSAVLCWLDTGMLKGYRKVGGTWKITQADLVTFSRDRRDLLLAATTRNVS